MLNDIKNSQLKASKMVYTYTPTYYSSLHDSISSLCKTILPFSFKKKRLQASAADQKLSKQHSDNLKWQQDSFHQILNLIGLCREGIVSETEVSAFRTQLLDFLVASPADQEPPVILRDKLVFLQELFYAKCISDEEYHSSKRPLLQRLAVQGVEIEARDLIVAKPKQNPEEEWSVIDLRDEDSLLNKENHLHARNKLKYRSTMKHIRGAGASAFGIGKTKDSRNVCAANSKAQHFGLNHQNEMRLLYRENPFRDSQFKGIESETRSILMPEGVPTPAEPINGDEVKKKKPFRDLVQREGSDGHVGVDYGHVPDGRAAKSGKKQWGFDGFKKWKRSNSEDETTPLKLSERSDARALLEPSDTRQIQKKLHFNGAESDYLMDKVLGDKTKKELLRIQTELCSTNHSLQFSNDQIEAISTKLPADKADLKKFFPKSWCDQNGNEVLNVVRKEFKDHVGEMESMRSAARENRRNPTQWEAFDDDENCDPNYSQSSNGYSCKSNNATMFHETNPFFQDSAREELNSESAFVNPFCVPSRHG